MLIFSYSTIIFWVFLSSIPRENGKLDDFLVYLNLLIGHFSEGKLQNRDWEHFWKI